MVNVTIDDITLLVGAIQDGDFIEIDRFGVPRLSRKVTKINFVTDIDNADIAAGAGIATSKLSDAANFVLINQPNTFDDFDQTFRDNRLLILSPDDLTPVTIVNAQQTLARNATIPILTGNRNFLMSAEGAIVNADLASGAFANITGVGVLATGTWQAVAIANGFIAQLPALGVAPSPARTTDVSLTTEVTGLLPNGNLANLPALGTLPASPRQTNIVNSEIDTVDTGKVTTGRFVLARLPTGTQDQFFRGQGASDPAFEAIEFTKGGTVIDSPTAAINIIVWRAPFACTVTNVRGYVVGGASSTINARRNGSLNHLASDLTVTPVDTWVDGGAVQNASYAAGDKLEIMIVTVVNTPTQIAIQVDFTRP